MCIGRFLSGFFIGAVTGGVLGVLMAPHSGEQTRELISNKSEEAYKYTEDSIKELQDKANHVIEDIQQKGDELLGKVQEVINKQKEA